MICHSTIRRFDGDAASTLYTAVFPRAATGLRFISWVTLYKATGTHAVNNDAPEMTMVWVPADRVHDETSNAAEIEAALADPDQIPLIVQSRGTVSAVAYITDGGSAFPVVAIKGAPMVLAVRLVSIAPGTHGQLTFGWTQDRC